jgi:hypothetical protein
MERETRFELATLALARRCSTTELLPRTTNLSIAGRGSWVKLQPGHSEAVAFYSIHLRLRKKGTMPVDV